MKYRARNGLYKAQTGAGMQAFSPNATRKQRLTKSQKDGFRKAVRKVMARAAREAKI